MASSSSTASSCTITEEERETVAIESLAFPVGSFDLQSALQTIEQGKVAFRKNLLNQAVLLFKDALSTMMSIYGRIHFECARPYYLLALAQLYTIPFSINDRKLAILPLEADQYLAVNDKVENTFKVKNKKRKSKAEDFAEAWMLLRCAFTSASTQAHKSILKAEILSALGEAGFRKGDDRAYIYYKEALRNLSEWLEETDIRNILLKLKMGICLENTSKEKALQFYEQALKLYEKRATSMNDRVQQGSEKGSEKDINALNKLQQLIKFQIGKLGITPLKSRSKKRRISDVITKNEFASKYYMCGGGTDLRKYWEKRFTPPFKTRFNAEALAPKTEIPPADRIVTRAGRAAAVAATRRVTRSATRATTGVLRPKSRSTR